VETPKTVDKRLVEILRVSAKSRPHAVAGAIASLLRSSGELEIQAIGPAAVNQSVKALAIARGYLEAEGLDLQVQPSFIKLELEDEERTAVKFEVSVVRL
jgi:stage V sporulation protein S